MSVGIPEADELTAAQIVSSDICAVSGQWRTDRY